MANKKKDTVVENNAEPTPPGAGPATDLGQVGPTGGEVPLGADPAPDAQPNPEQSTEGLEEKAEPSHRHLGQFRRQRLYSSHRHAGRLLPAGGRAASQQSRGSSGDYHPSLVTGLRQPEGVLRRRPL